MQLPELGHQFESRYEIRAILGEGAFARVFKAWDHQTNRMVALKVLSPTGAEYSKLTGARFLREARTIASLHDSHTITMYDFGETSSGLLYMACEYIDGRDGLTLLAQEAPLRAATVAHILQQALESLREAHGFGVLHRDIKPANMLVFRYQGDDYRVKIVDFGLAKPTNVDAIQLTAEGRTPGTPRYMSPEQALGDPLGPPTDIYSLGLVAYELLTGHPAVNAPNIALLLKEQIAGAPMVVPEAMAPEALRRIIEKMAERSLERRYRTAEEVLVDLLAARHEIRGWGAAIPDGPALPLVIGEPNESATGRDVEPLPMRPKPVIEKRSFLPLLALGAVVALALGGAAAVLLTAPAVPDEPRIALPLPPPVEDPTPPPPPPPPPEVAADCVGLEAFKPGIHPIETDDGTAWVRIPEGYDARRRHKLAVLFHDAWEMPERALTGPDYAAIDGAEQWVVVAPSGDPLAKSRHWQKKDVQDSAFRQLAAATARLCVPADRPHVVGYGAGGFPALELACSELGAVSVATFAFRPVFRPGGHRKGLVPICRPAEPVPMLTIIPKDDGLRPYSGGQGCNGKTPSAQEGLDQLRGVAGCMSAVAVETEPDGTCRTFDCPADFTVCEVAGDREWPGPGTHIDSAAILRLVKDCPASPRTEFAVTKRIWDFFADNAVGAPSESAVPAPPN